MEQSTFHCAIIMDGNGRWAEERGRPRADGHRAGALTVERTVEAAPALGITDLTLYAFSSDNWKRPRREVALLMRLFEQYLREQTERCIREGVRVNVIGRRDRLAAQLVRSVEESERATSHGERLMLRIAVDYSSRDSIVRAAANPSLTREEFAAQLSAACHSREPMPDVDLLIRTGREHRLSDFLLWEASYAELVFPDVMWPDFSERDFAAAVSEFRRRTRRFGGLVEVIDEAV
jgi:undecaprenyl diphosphate synthase